MGSPPSLRDVAMGERELGMSDEDQSGGEACAQDPRRQIVQYTGYWDLELRMPDRPMPPPPADMTDTEAVEKWRRHCWMLRNIFGSGN